MIDVYSAIAHHEKDDFRVSRDYTVDGVIARLEGVLRREYEKGGTAASIKAAMDRAIDQLHAETGGARDKARDVVVRTDGQTARKIRQRRARERVSGYADSITMLAERALALLHEWVQSDSLRRHCYAVADSMRHFAQIARRGRGSVGGGGTAARHGLRAASEPGAKPD